MANKKEAILKFDDFNGTTDYDDKYFRHKTINNYLFRDEENTLYRWTTKKIVDFIKDKKYKIEFKILKDRGFSNEIVIGYLKIEEWARNGYGDEFWREVRQYNASELRY